MAGSALIVGAIITVVLRWIADGAGQPPLARGWLSQAAQCGYVLLTLAAVKMLTDINATSLHAFYRDRLAAAYGVVRRSGQDGPLVQDAPWAKLSMLPQDGQPELVICAAANCTTRGDLPPGRGSVSFTFAPSEVGLSRGTTHADRAPTAGYEAAAGLTLFDAVAVSGAAVSPVMGKMTRPSMRILLAAADVRLGVWLPSPARVRDGNLPLAAQRPSGSAGGGGSAVRCGASGGSPTCGTCGPRRPARCTWTAAGCTSRTAATTRTSAWSRRCGGGRTT